MEKIIRKNDTATISLVGNQFGVSVKVELFNGKVFQGAFAQATAQMNFPATHSHYVADANSNLPITVEASQIILAELPNFQKEVEENFKPLRRTYTDEWTGETKYLDEKMEAVGESEEVKAIRAEISELKSMVEMHDEKEEVREADTCRNKIVELSNKLKMLKGENK